MKLNSKSIGNKIRELRKKSNLSQAELAQKVSISPQAAGKWERGESLPDITILNLLAEIFGVDLNYFSESFQSADTEMPPAENSEKKSTEFTIPNQKKKHSWDMSDGNWEHVDFSGLMNLQETFSSSNIKNCKFIGSDLSKLLLKNNNFDSCDFSRSNMNSSNFQKSNIAHSLFNECSSKETKFLASYIFGCDFTETDFTEAEFNACGFEKNIILNAVWKNTAFNETRIASVIFNGSIKGCSFEKCSFSKVTFQNAKLESTFFKYTILKNVRFIDCQADLITYELLKHGKADLTGLTLLT